MSDPDAIPPPIKVFILYAPGEERSAGDEAALDRLLEELAPLKWDGKILCRTDRDILAGKDFRRQMTQYIEEAHLILILHSPLFYGSPVCSEYLPVVMAQHRNQKAVVAPIFVRTARPMDKDIAKLQPMPGNHMPIGAWLDKDEAWCDVVYRTEQLVSELQRYGLPRRGSGLEEVFQDFSSIASEIRESIEGADDIWMLTRTGQGWWRDFPELEKKLSEGSGNHRVLVLSPDCAAFKFIRHEWRPWHFKPTKTFGQYEADARAHLRRMRKVAASFVKATDVIPPIVFLLTRSTVGREVIYAEYPMFYTAPGEHGAEENRYQKRPIVKIEPSDRHFFDLFSLAFEDLWSRSSS